MDATSLPGSGALYEEREGKDGAGGAESLALRRGNGKLLAWAWIRGDTFSHFSPLLLPYFCASYASYLFEYSLLPMWSIRPFKSLFNFS
jgi:hypothetical protein